jgi:hypothetical protein
MQWRKRTDFASAIVYERCIREFGFRDVPFGLSFVFAHRPGDDTARTKILDRTPYRNYQQLDRLCHWIANGTAWLYSSKPVLHLRIRVQHAVVGQETNTHKSTSGPTTEQRFGRGWYLDEPAMRYRAAAGTAQRRPGIAWYIFIFNCKRHNYAN